MGILAALLIAAPPVLGKKKKSRDRDPEELFNPFLGVELSHWLVGPIQRIATGDEVDAYLLITSDDDARSFIEEFWARRAEGVGVFEKKPRQVYDERVLDADKRFSEGANPGHLTDRGTVFVVFGEPEKVEFESGKQVGDPPTEAWEYPKDAGPGLGGEPPERFYRFIEIDGQVVAYNSQRLEQMRRRRLPEPDRF